MSLFRLGYFTLHSGGVSRWKIDCDPLTADDWAALAVMLVERLPPFGAVVGVPRGGLALAEALWKHAAPDGLGRVLVADDVTTTGASLEEARRTLLASGNLDVAEVVGAVVFARGPCPDWVTPLFRMA